MLEYSDLTHRVIMKYFIVENQKSVGPFEVNQLQARGLTKDTLVWCEGMPDWVAAGNVPELAYLFATQAEDPIPRQPYTQQPPHVAPSTHLVEAILATLFCCLPLGIVAIIKAVKVSNANSRGDYETAAAESAEAFKWVKFSVLAGLIYLVVMVVISFMS